MTPPMKGSIWVSTVTAQQKPPGTSLTRRRGATALDSGRGPCRVSGRLVTHPVPALAAGGERPAFERLAGHRLVGCGELRVDHLASTARSGLQSRRSAISSDSACMGTLENHRVTATASPNDRETKQRRPGGLRCSEFWSGRRDSNPRPSPWQGDALPAELRPHVGLVRIATGIPAAHPDQSAFGFRSTVRVNTPSTSSALASAMIA